MQHPGDRFFVVVTIAMGRVRELTGEVGNELTVYALLVRQLGYDHGPATIQQTPLGMRLG